jgi:hypothetical protein
MPDDLFGFNAEDIRRIRKAVEFYEQFQHRQVMRRPQMPASVEGVVYVTGILDEDLDP